MAERLLYAFGILYRLDLCLFISFKFIKIFIGNCSRLRGFSVEKIDTACTLLEHTFC
jgi:hypothetical protein